MRFILSALPDGISVRGFASGNKGLMNWRAGTLELQCSED